MALTLGMITVDTTDPPGLAAWWAARTGAELSESHAGWYEVLKGGGLPVLLAFQRVEKPTPGKNRLHLDLVTENLEGEVDALLAAGAQLVARHEEGGARWTTLADPCGNEFCVGEPGGHDY
jgi:hypothetical protein